MTDSDRASFAVVLARCAEVFQFQLSDGLVAEYFKALINYPFVQVRWAIEQCIVDCLFFPKPKEILTAMFHEKHEGHIDETPKRLALPEYHDPEVYAEWKRQKDALIAKIASKMPTIPRVTPDEVNPPKYGEVVKREGWAMTESHWRARWDLARMSPDLDSLRHAIPEHFRIQFAKEDADSDALR